MAIKESREIVIEAAPEEILDVIADFEAMPSGRAASERGDPGDRRRRAARKVKMKVKTAGITDEQVVAYTWSDNEVSWTLVSSGQQKSQDAEVHADPEGDKNAVKFEISVDPTVPLPGFVLKRAIKGRSTRRTKACASGC